MALRGTSCARRAGAPPDPIASPPGVRPAHPLPDPPTPSPQPAAAPKVPLVVRAAALAAATMMLATPVFAADVKDAVCARTPTAKICLRGSANE